MFIVFNRDISGEGMSFTFKKDAKYIAHDGSEVNKELAGTYLVKQPNSPKDENWCCRVSKKSPFIKEVIKDCE